MSAAQELHPDALLVQRSLEGDVESCRALVEQLTPVIRAKIRRTLAQTQRPSSDASDFAQEIFRLLFENDGRLLRGWDPRRGMSLASYVALIAQQQTRAILKSGRRSGWAETEQEPTSKVPASASRRSPSPEGCVVSRDLLRKAFGRLSPNGQKLFLDLLIHGKDTETVCSERHLSRDAVYQFRSRLVKLIGQVQSDPIDQELGDDALDQVVGGATLFEFPRLSTLDIALIAMPD